MAASLVAAAILVFGINTVRTFLSPTPEIVINWASLTAGTSIGTGATLSTFAVLATVVVAMVFSRQDSNLTQQQALQRIEQKAAMLSVSMFIGMAASLITVVYICGVITSLGASAMVRPTLWEAVSVVFAGQAIAWASVFTESSRGDQALLARVQLRPLIKRHELISKKWNELWKLSPGEHISRWLTAWAPLAEALYLSVGFLAFYFTFKHALPNDTGLVGAALFIIWLLWAISLSVGFFLALTAAWISRAARQTNGLTMVLATVGPSVGGLLLSLSHPEWASVWWAAALASTLLVVPLLPWRLPPKNSKRHFVAVMLLAPGFVLRQRIQISQNRQRISQIANRRKLAGELRALRSSWPVRRVQRPPRWTNQQH